MLPALHLLNTDRCILDNLLYIFFCSFFFRYRCTAINLNILVVVSGGNSETSSGDLMDTFQLQEIVKQLTGNGIKIVGALIPNKQGTKRIQQLQSIFSEPKDAINKDFDDTTPIELAEQLAMRVKRWVCPGRNFYATKGYLF